MPLVTRARGQPRHRRTCQGPMLSSRIIRKLSSEVGTLRWRDLGMMKGFKQGVSQIGVLALRLFLQDVACVPE